MTDLTILQTRLAEAEAALHALMVGGRVAECTGMDGSRISYQAGQAVELRRYIQLLEQQIESAQSSRRRGPIHIVF